MDVGSPLCDARTGAPFGRPLTGHDAAINGVGFGADGRMCVDARALRYAPHELPRA